MVVLAHWQQAKASRSSVLGGEICPNFQATKTEASTGKFCNAMILRQQIAQTYRAVLPESRRESRTPLFLVDLSHFKLLRLFN